MIRAKNLQQQLTPQLDGVGGGGGGGGVGGSKPQPSGAHVIFVKVYLMPARTQKQVSFTGNFFKSSAISGGLISIDIRI